MIWPQPTFLNFSLYPFSSVIRCQADGAARQAPCASPVPRTCCSLYQQLLLTLWFISSPNILTIYHMPGPVLGTGSTEIGKQGPHMQGPCGLEGETWINNHNESCYMLEHEYENISVTMEEKKDLVTLRLGESLPEKVICSLVVSCEWCGILTMCSLL